ncbi:hypothetical protein DW262_11455, partial [Segatella copri]
IIIFCVHFGELLQIGSSTCQMITISEINNTKITPKDSRISPKNTKISPKDSRISPKNKPGKQMLGIR